MRSALMVLAASTVITSCLAPPEGPILTAVPTASRPLGSADPVVVSPDVYTVRLDNEHVRVLEMRLPAGRGDRPHGHPNEIVRFLTPGTARITLANGQVVEKAVTAGEELWNAPWAHQVQNIGTSDLHAVIVELKEAPRPLAPAGADPTRVSSAHYRASTDNEHLRTVVMRLGPGEQDVMHAHPGYVAYFRSPADLAFNFPDGRSGSRRLAAGEVLWSPPTVHQVTNRGATPAEVWIVELKPRNAKR